MSVRPATDQPWFKLKLEQSRRLAATPGLKIEGFIASPENSEFFAARGVDINKFNASADFTNSTSDDRRPADFRRPLYSPFAPTGQIRILHIEPGEADEPLRCRLQHHRLQESRSYDPHVTSYDALSYTWNAPLRTRYYTKGPPQPVEEFTPKSWLASALGDSAYTISDSGPRASFEPRADQVDESELMRPVETQIDGRICEVTGNLAAALEHLRLPDCARNLWVDALCIDQQNLQERSEQVAQMDRIYQCADTVHIWLGPAADGSDRAMSLAQAVWQYAFVAEAVPMELLQCHKDKNTTAMLARLEELTVLLMRPWFTRRWVVQELALARHALVHCGSMTIPWQRLAYVIAFLQSNRLELRDMRIRHLYLQAEPKKYRRGYLKTLAAETLAQLTEAAMRRLPSPSTHPVFQRHADLEYLLSSLAPLQCADPLDTVYALLAIASDTAARGIGSPDYKKSVRQLYEDVVLRIMKSKHSLNILCRCWAADTHSSIEMPTWIQACYPAATRHEGGADEPWERRKFVGNGDKCVFRACGTRKKQGTPGKLEDVDGIGRKLMVTGIVIDVIETVLPGAFQNIPTSWEDLVINGAQPPRAPEDESKVRDSAQAFTALPYAPHSKDHLTASERYAIFADLLTASSRSVDTYASLECAIICEALFATNSPYRSSTTANGINLFTVTPEPDPPQLLHPTTKAPFPSSDLTAFLAATAACTLHRAIARTRKGTLALVDALIPQAKPGDVICVLIGCDVPVVLRPRSKMDFASTMSHGVFEIVSEAYVQGFMFGEAFELSPKKPERENQVVGRFFLV